MRPVNLIPPELRPRVPGDGDPRIAYGILGGLAVLLLMVIVSISYSNKAKTLNDEAASLRAEATKRQAVVAVSPKNTEDVGELIRRRTLLVGGLAAARFPWDDSMGDLSRSIPPDVTLDAIDATSAVADAGAAADAASAEASSKSGPTLALEGCASGWVGYSRLLTWLRQMPGVEDVNSVTSQLTPRQQADTGVDGEKAIDRTGNCGPAPLNFSLKVIYSQKKVDLLGLPRPTATQQAASGGAGGAAAPDAAASTTAAQTGTGG